MVAIKGFQALGRETLSPGINYRGPVKEQPPMIAREVGLNDSLILNELKDFSSDAYKNAAAAAAINAMEVL